MSVYIAQGIIKGDKLEILTVNTGNDKLDDAYKRMQIHISTFNNVEEFENYFNSILKGNDPELVKKWLMKVLFWEFKYGRDEGASAKHDFDVLCENVSAQKKKELKAWLELNLRKVKKA